MYGYIKAGQQCFITPVLELLEWIVSCQTGVDLPLEVVIFELIA